MEKMIQWEGNPLVEAIDTLEKGGKIIVSPTKVGYIIMTTDRKGLERKFSVKKRNSNKPGVVLCSSIEQLTQLAETNKEILDFYQKHWEKDILLGCILPWKDTGKKYIPKDGSESLMMDQRSTSCFVIRFGKPSEQIVKHFWDNHKKLIFASSANPSGKGNRGVIKGVGSDIENDSDLLIEADDFVKSIQPTSDEGNRYEQGVMVSMVDDLGNIIPIQNSDRGILPCPILIRKGLDVHLIMNELSDIFNTWNYRQGSYY